MSNFMPDLYWEYNCGADDFDFWVDWGDLTIQKYNLQNRIEGW